MLTLPFCLALDSRSAEQEAIFGVHVSLGRGPQEAAGEEDRKGEREERNASARLLLKLGEAGRDLTHSERFT